MIIDTTKPTSSDSQVDAKDAKDAKQSSEQDRKAQPYEKGQPMKTDAKPASGAPSNSQFDSAQPKKV